MGLPLGGELQGAISTKWALFRGEGNCGALFVRFLKEKQVGGQVVMMNAQQPLIFAES
ncbi:hypothetical protein PAENIP36_23370 [Paenibacillus sp. P36]